MACTLLVQADGSQKVLELFQHPIVSSKGHAMWVSDACHSNEAYASRAADNTADLLLQIGFTGLALKLNTSDSAAKEKWLDVMRKENDQMVCNCLDAKVMHARRGVSVLVMHVHDVSQ